MSIPTTIVWSLYAPFVVQKLAREYGYSIEQAQMHTEERTATAEHALRAIMFPSKKEFKHIADVVCRAKPETKIAVGVGAGVLSLGLIGLLVWLLKRK